MERNDQAAMNKFLVRVRFVPVDRWGAHGLLRRVPLATNCWRGGGGGGCFASEDWRSRDPYGPVE